MKKNNRITVVVVLLALSAFTASPANALTESQAAAVKKAIVGTSAAELAAKAAELVARATKTDKEQTAVAVVRAAVTKSPSSAASVVSTVVTVAPSTAAKVVAAVAELAPDQVEVVARVAAQAAPDEANKIVAEVAKVAPKQSERVAQAVKLAATTSAKAKDTVKTTRVSANSVRVFPPGSGGNIIQLPNPINPRLVFPSAPPKDVSNYAAPGSDPGR